METPQLHHCTKYESLCKILESGAFLPSYCLEQSNFMHEFTEAAYAVVCFADLLPDEVERHAANFNSDSFIVMSKEWALRNNVAPVIYYYPKTIAAVAFQKWVKFCIDKELPLSKEREDILLSNSTNLMFAYMKQYEGVYFDDNKKGFSDETRVFYLEREWRWLPWVENGEAYYLTKDLFLNENIRKGKRQELINHGYTLKFTPADVIEVGIPQDKVEDFEQNFGEIYKVVELKKDNISIDNTAKLQDILKQLNEIIGTENEDYNEISLELEEELAKPNPSKNIIKRNFQAIKGLTSDVVSEVLANQCSDLIQSALSFV